MTTCKNCGAPIAPPRRAYCSDECAALSHTAYLRAKYQSDPADRERRKAASRARSAAQRNDYRRQKRARFTRILANAQLARHDAGVPLGAEAVRGG